MQERAGGKEHHYGWKADVSFRASGPWIGFIVSLMMERCGAPSARGGVRSLLVSLAEEDASLMEGFAGGPLWLLGQRPLETLALCVLLQISKLHTHKHTHTYTHTHTHTHTNTHTHTHDPSTVNDRGTRATWLASSARRFHIRFSLSFRGRSRVADRKHYRARQV